MKKKTSSRVRSKTDWKRLDAMRDEDIDYSDCPPMTPEMFARGVVRMGLKPVVRRKQQITLRLDSDVLDWFRTLGAGYQSQINALLRAYMVEHQKQR
jgi:uncharacterized protein (DUF4415 family)